MGGGGITKNSAIKKCIRIACRGVFCFKTVESPIKIFGKLPTPEPSGNELCPPKSRPFSRLGRTRVQLNKLPTGMNKRINIFPTYKMNLLFNKLY